MSELSLQRHLMVLQARDVEIDQLLHKRAHLPAKEVASAAIIEAASLKSALDNEASAARSASQRLDEIETETSKIETRITFIEEQLYGPGSSAAKDAQAMADEVTHLKAKRSALDDDGLEAMETLEVHRAESERLGTRARELSAGLEKAQAEQKAGEDEIDAELAVARQAREGEVATLGADVLERYDSLRKHLGGVAVAELEGQRCGGCHLTLSSHELARLRDAGDDEISTCEECGRILVVTSD